MLCVAATAELVGEVPWSPAKAKQPSIKRLVWAHDPQRAAEESAKRQLRMDEIFARADNTVSKLDAQDDGKTGKGRKLSDAGAKARLYREVIEARLGHIIEVDLQSEQLTWQVNECHHAVVETVWPMAVQQQAGGYRPVGAAMMTTATRRSPPAYTRQHAAAPP